MGCAVPPFIILGPSHLSSDVGLFAPTTEVLKGISFEWTDQAHSTFEEIKRTGTTGPILALSYFSQILKVECNALGVGVGVVLSQEKRPMAFFSEKLNKAKRKYSAYDKEFYTIVRALEHCQHYLVGEEFILHSEGHSSD